jgi:hypothetical protein
LRTPTILAAALAASLLTLVAPTSATAVTYVDVTADDVTVKYDSCKKSTVTVSGDWDLDVYNEIDVTVRNPHGRVFDTAAFYDDEDGLVTTGVRLCNGNTQGTYTVEVTATGYDEFYEETSSAVGTASFRYKHVPKVGSRIRHRVYYRSERPTYKYVVPGQLVRGGKGYADARVVLAARIDGSWYAIDKQRTKRRGFFGWEFKPNAFRWRYYYLGNRSTKPSVSDAFRTPRRSNARVVATQDVSVADVRELVQRG